MARDPAEVIQKLPPPNGWQSWPTGVPAAIKLGVAPNKLRLLVQSGNLACYPCPDRTKRFDPEDLEKLARDLKQLDGDGDDEFALDELEEPAKPSVGTEMWRALIEALKSSNAMVLEMHKILTSGSESQAKTYKEIVTLLMSRESSREKVICDVYAARESYYNEQQERDLRAKQHSNVEERRQEMWTITKGHLDKFVDIAYAKFGVPKEVMAKLEPAIELLQKLSPMQLQMLLGSQFLTKEQEALVRRIVNEVPPAEDVSERVAAECAAILQKQAEDKKAEQAAQTAAAQAATPASSSPAPASALANWASDASRVIVAALPATPASSANEATPASSANETTPATPASNPTERENPNA